MCGFAGVIGECPSVEAISSMLAAIPHSGTHKYEYIRGPNFHLGCSHGGNHCRASLSTTLGGGIAFFGELGNPAILRARVSKSNHSAAETDADLVHRYYKTYGITRFDEIDGFFSIALLDSRRNSCFLVSDYWGAGAPFYSKISARKAVIF